MLFNSYIFLFIFLPVSLLGFYLLGKKSRELAILWLVASSLFFYAWWSTHLLSLLIGSILVNYFIGQLLVMEGARRSYTILVIGVVLNLSLLGYFKYANFFIDNINQVFSTSLFLDLIVLPLAISFFTFQQITYLIDTYKKDTIKHNFIHYCLFVTFFPQLIAGPIVHHKEMLSQFAKGLFYKIDLHNVSFGLTIFTIGLFKKVILADGISVYSTAMFNAAGQGFVLSSFEY
ncbi:MAG: alginate O-acetyltransferase complex protein AlgI [Psychroserpens sp.]|jgi:alginate O-acetyltransferase complex protein AlgI